MACAGRRAQIVLACAEAESHMVIAKQLGLSHVTVGKWRCRSHQQGTAGLQDEHALDHLASMVTSVLPK